MPYRERTREFWFKVADYKCQYEQYTEKRGFRNCGSRADHVHHIIGEAEQLMNGEDPEHSVGLPLCQNHHVRNTGEFLGDTDSSFHPDVGHAYVGYGEWKQNKLHMNEITGKRTVDYSDSPFAETAAEHRSKINKGERYINGDERADEYYIQKMRSLAMLYLARHPEERKPDTKPHPEFKKKGKWWDNLF